MLGYYKNIAYTATKYQQFEIIMTTYLLWTGNIYFSQLHYSFIN